MATHTLNDYLAHSASHIAPAATIQVGNALMVIAELEAGTDTPLIKACAIGLIIENLLLAPPRVGSAAAAVLAALGSLTRVLSATPVANTALYEYPLGAGVAACLEQARACSLNEMHKYSAYAMICVLGVCRYTDGNALPTYLGTRLTKAVASMGTVIPDTPFPACFPDVAKAIFADHNPYRAKMIVDFVRVSPLASMASAYNYVKELMAWVNSTIVGMIMTTVLSVFPELQGAPSLSEEIRILNSFIGAAPDLSLVPYVAALGSQLRMSSRQSAMPILASLAMTMVTTSNPTMRSYALFNRFRPCYRLLSELLACKVSAHSSEVVNKFEAVRSSMLQGGDDGGDEEEFGTGTA